MYSTTTQRRVIPGGSGGYGRKFDSTLDHITRGGLPINPKILAEIKNKLKSGVFKLDRNAFITELKTDPGLFIYAVKKLHSLTTTTSEGISPENELRILSDEALVKLFDVSEGDISPFRSRNMTSVQALRLQHSIMSSNAAMTIAERAELNSDEAYSAALFRQLGLSLISWSYPEQYRQALRVQRTGSTTLDAELERVIGVSPIEVSHKLSLEWRISPAIRRALMLDSKKGQVNPQQNTETALSISEICNFSEMFARANDPENYPNAQYEWERAGETVSQKCGSDIIQLFNDRNEASFKLYEDITHFTPALMHRPAPAGAVEVVTDNRINDLLQANVYLKECCPDTRETFGNLYNLMERDPKVSLNALKFLVESVIPANGFLRGCLYLMDEKALSLKPSLRIGDKPLSNYPSFKSHQNAPVTASIDSTVPIIQKTVSEDGSSISKICGALGTAKPKGVLFLEQNNEFFNGRESDALLYYHAIRVTLMDCLSMEKTTWPDKKAKRAFL